MVKKIIIEYIKYNFNFNKKVCKKGDVGDCMYIIYSGKIDVMI